MDDKQLTTELERQIRHWHRLRWLSTMVVGAILLICVAAGAYQLHIDSERLAASCSFYKDLAGAQLMTTKQNPHPGELAVHLLLDSRIAFYGEGCTGGLKPPSASLLHWAVYYHLHVLP